MTKVIQETVHLRIIILYLYQAWTDLEIRDRLIWFWIQQQYQLLLTYHEYRVHAHIKGDREAGFIFRTHVIIITMCNYYKFKRSSWISVSRFGNSSLHDYTRHYNAIRESAPMPNVWRSSVRVNFKLTIEYAPIILAANDTLKQHKLRIFMIEVNLLSDHFAPRTRNDARSRRCHFSLCLARRHLHDTL